MKASEVPQGELGRLAAIALLEVVEAERDALAAALRAAVEALNQAYDSLELDCRCESVGPAKEIGFPPRVEAALNAIDAAKAQAERALGGKS